MLDRLTELTFFSAIYGAVFGILYFGWSRPTPGFVGEPFWDKGKVTAGLVLVFVLALDVIFDSGLRSRVLYSGFGSLALIWFAEIMLVPTTRTTVLPKPDAVRITGFIVHSFWAIFVFYGVLFG